MPEDRDLKSALVQLENTLEIYLVQKSPISIPEKWKELIVRFTPYFAILGALVSIPLMIGGTALDILALPFGALLAPTYFFSPRHIINMLSMIILTASTVLEIIAIPGLFKRTLRGWRFVFYASLLFAVEQFFNLVGGERDLLGLLWIFLEWFTLFQVKEYYKDGLTPQAVSQETNAPRSNEENFKLD